MRSGGPIQFVAAAVLLLAPAPAPAGWPVDGLPIAVAPGREELHAVVADGAGAFFVGWLDPSVYPYEARVLRVLVDGTTSPGWPVAGAVQPIIPGYWSGRFKIARDGVGGCFIAWDELLLYPTNGYYYVRLKRLTSTGALAPGWPGDGVVVASGFVYDNELRVTVEELVEAPDGSCFVVYSSYSSGCHDGICGAGGDTRFARIGANGVLLSSGVVEPWCNLARHPALRITAVSDGGLGLFTCSHTPCGSASRVRHVLVGGEAGSALLAPTFPRTLTRLADGSVVAGAEVEGSGPRLFHWSIEGAPVAEFPAAGVTLPAATYWNLATNAEGSSVFAWMPSALPLELRALRVTGQGAVAPGWEAGGVVVTNLPTVPIQYPAVGPDGYGGAHVVWVDDRAAASGADLYASHVPANGTLPPGQPHGGYPLCMAPGGQWGARVVSLAPGVAVAVWQDGRSGRPDDLDIYAQRLSFDLAVPAEASLARAEARPDRVSLEWRLSERVPEVAIGRTRDGHAWSQRARLVPGSLGSVMYEDTDVRPGESLGYRLEFRSNGEPVHTTPVWVEIPVVELALRALASPTRDRLAVEVALASDEPARLELVDVSGRQRLSMDLTGRSPGMHQLEVPIGDVEPSIAWLRLRQGHEARTLRVAITR